MGLFEILQDLFLAAGQGGEEVAPAARRGGRGRRRYPLVGSVRITPPRVRGRRRAGGGPAIPVVVLAPQEEGEGEVEDQGPALLGGGGEQGAQRAAAPLPAPGPAPLLAPQRRVVRGWRGSR